MRRLTAKVGNGPKGYACDEDKERRHLSPGSRGESVHAVRP